MHRFYGKQATATHPHSTEPHRDADCPEATGRRADRCGVAVASVSLRPGRNRVRIPAMKKGDLVQTPLGRGIVREVRNRGRALVEVRGRATEVSGSQITLADRAGRLAGRRFGRVSDGARRRRRAGHRSVPPGGPFFLTVKPRARTARQTVGTLAGVARASFSSASVRSGCAAIRSAKVCRGGSSMPRRPCRWTRGATSPVSRRRCFKSRTHDPLTRSYCPKTRSWGLTAGHVSRC